MDQPRSRSGQLVVGHRGVCGAKVHHTRRYLPDSCARSFSPIADRTARMDRIVFTEPFRVNRVGESSADPSQLLAPRCSNRHDEQHHGHQGLLHTPSPRRHKTSPGRSRKNARLHETTAVPELLYPETTTAKWVFPQEK